MQLEVMLLDHSSRMLFSLSTDSTKPILISPSKDLLIHVRSFGFYEWVESAGKGKPVRLPQEFTGRWMYSLSRRSLTSIEPHKATVTQMADLPELLFDD